MNSVIKAAVAGALLAASISAFAEEKSNAVSIFGSISNSSVSGGSSSTTTFVSGEYERLFSDNLAVGASVSVAKFGNSTTTSLLLRPKYYFGSFGKAGAFIPYVGLAVGNSHTSGGYSDNQTETGAFLGTEYAVTEAASFFVELEALRISGSNGGGDISLTELVFGLKYHF